MARTGISSPVTTARIRRLRADRDQAETAMRKHQQICAQCHSGAVLSRDACDTGWELAIKRARARNRWANRAAIVADNATQGKLF